MDTEKFKMGWLLVIIERPDAKLRRFLRLEYHRLNPGTYARPCVPFTKCDEHIERLRTKLPTESRIRAIWVTRAQWERSCVCSGPPAQRRCDARPAPGTIGPTWAATTRPDVGCKTKGKMKKFQVIDSDGGRWGEFDDLDLAIAEADEICGRPTSPESRRAKARRTGHAVYAIQADRMQSPSAAQVNENF